MALEFSGVNSALRADTEAWSSNPGIQLVQCTTLGSNSTCTRAPVQCQSTAGPGLLAEDAGQSCRGASPPWATSRALVERTL